MVSVIVPVYNVKPYLQECLDSILQQSYTKMEIILIDDGSTDGSGAICDDYARKDDRIQVIHQQNQGLSAARNRGIERATGEYLCFVDSDDYLYPNSIDTLLRLCTQYEADMSVCTHDRLEGGKLYPSHPEKCASPSVEIFHGDQKMDAYLRQHKITATVWGKMYAAELFREIRFPTGKLYEDAYIMHLLLHEARCIAYLPQSVYVYRIRPDSITRSAFSPQSMDRVDAHDQLLRFTEVHYPALLNYAQAVTVCTHIDLLFRLFDSDTAYPALQKQLRGYCRKHFTVYMTHGNFRKLKMYLPLLCVSLPLAKLVYRLYFKMKAIIRKR